MDPNASKTLSLQNSGWEINKYLHSCLENNSIDTKYTWFELVYFCLTHSRYLHITRVIFVEVFFHSTPLEQYLHIFLAFTGLWEQILPDAKCLISNCTKGISEMATLIGILTRVLLLSLELLGKAISRKWCFITWNKVCYTTKVTWTHS